jgi:hypothetical protein
MKHLAHLNIALVVAACVLAAQCAPSAPAPEPAATQEPVNSIADIEGQWDVVSFDGYRPRRLDSDGGRHAYVDFIGDRVGFAIECNYSGIETARIDNGRLVRVAGDAVQTEMGCGPEREGRDEAFFAFLRNSPSVARRGADELVLERGGVTLELLRAEVRQRENAVRTLAELDGAWTTAIIYQTVEPGHGRNVLAFSTPPGTAALTFANGAVRMTFDCETAQTQVQLSAPGALTAGTPQRTTSGRCTLSQEDRDIAASLITGALTAERIDPNMVHLVGDDVRAVLTRS